MSERFQHKDNKDSIALPSTVPASPPSTLLYDSLSSLDMVEIEPDGLSIALFLQQGKRWDAMIPYSHKHSKQMKSFEV